MPRLHHRLMFVPLALSLYAPANTPADEVIDAVVEPLTVPAEQLAAIGAAGGDGPDQATGGSASPPASTPLPQARPTSTVIEQTDWQATSVATVATVQSADPAAGKPADTGAAGDERGTGAAALHRLPRQAWNGGKTIVGAAWRDLMHPPPQPAMRAISAEDARASCEALYYQTLELMQVQQAKRTLPAYWDDNRNQAIGFLGVVASPFYYLWGVTATQSHHRSQADIAMNARLDALRHAAAQQRCFIR